MTLSVNIVSPEFKANPFPFLANLRNSQPFYRTELPDKTSVWLISRYEDVAALLRDERFVKHRRNAITPEQLRKMPWVPKMFRPLERNMLDLDPPDHTRLRALVHKAFTPNLMGKMRERIQTLAKHDLARVGGSADVVWSYGLADQVKLLLPI
jgi:cytochrome P450